MQEAIELMDKQGRRVVLSTQMSIIFKSIFKNPHKYPHIKTEAFFYRKQFPKTAYLKM